MKVAFYKSSSEFRSWLEENHDRARELWVGFYKKDSSKTGITYAEALDEALCYGWIDGIRKKVDAISYTNRFTSRNPKSHWSMVNIARARELRELGLMKPSGLKTFQARDQEKSERHSHERKSSSLSRALEKRFRANKKAWSFFQDQAPGYQRLATWWIMSAKKEETQLRRLAVLVQNSEKGRKLKWSG